MRSIRLGCLVGCLLAAHAPAATRYVATNGLHVAPYDSWANAATSLHAAVLGAQDGDLVLVTNGVYGLGRNLSVAAGLEIRSINGAAVTILDGETTNVSVSISHPAAVLDGFTVQRCRGFVGGGVYLDEGARLLRSVIRDNRAALSGGGVHANLDCVISQCVIANNEVLADGDGGGVLALRGARIDSCVIVSNTARAGGGVALHFQGEMVNCLVTHNAARMGGGVLVGQGSRLVNCTVTRNTADAAGGAHLFLGGELRNCIVWDNAAARGSNLVQRSSRDSAPAILYSAVAPLPAGPGNLDGDPLFIAPGASDFRLQTNSPAVDAGTNDGAPAVDLSGAARPQDGNGDTNAVADLGAYERAP